MEVSQKMLEYIQDLHNKQLELRQDLYIADSKTPVAMQSNPCDQIYAAFANAQGEMDTAILDARSNYWKVPYATLYSITNVARRALHKNKLAYTQPLVHEEDGVTMLYTRITHATGQWFQSSIRIVPPKNDIETFRSYVNAMRAHALASLLGISIPDEDDHGEYAMLEAREAVAKGSSLKYNPKEESHDTITKEQLEELQYELSDYPDIAEEVMDRLRLRSLADMPKSKFLVSINRIREIKDARKS